MKITIIKDDSQVGVDGLFRDVDLSSLDSTIHAVQYDTVAQVGHVEFKADLDPRRPNQDIGRTKFEKLFNQYVKAWRAAGEPPVRSLSEIRADQWAAIKSRRENAKQGGYLCHEKWFHSDDASRVQQLGLKDKARDLIAAGGAMSDIITIGNEPLMWKTMDGTFIAITAQIAYDLIDACSLLDAFAFTVAEQHRQAMFASADPANYDYSQGWPESYGAS